MAGAGMKRTPLQRKTPLRAKGWAPPPAKERARPPLKRIEGCRGVIKPVSADRKAVAPKIDGRKVQAIRDSARGEECTVRIPGVCTFDAEKTIWSHAPFGAAGKGRGIKAIDLAGAYCCTACDAVIDGQAPLPPGLTRQQAELDWFHGHMRSLVRLMQKGLA